ncbi:hypothetical protein EV421DRAFT_1834470 [Armillaria borealis]|uniref:Uncharacterized protein n=1 Tax=Armillaria borealis TaxID=47425 RepID=A0AA39MJA5_9AGAR|nr:hypothetical protein EV421DRAFT_1834470 [Armillaria borealis]
MQDQEGWIYATYFGSGAFLTLSIEAEFFTFILRGCHDTCIAQPRMRRVVALYGDKLIPTYTSRSLPSITEIILATEMEQSTRIMVVSALPVTAEACISLKTLDIGRSEIATRHVGTVLLSGLNLYSRNVRPTIIRGPSKRPLFSAWGWKQAVIVFRTYPGILKAVVFT